MVPEICLVVFLVASVAFIGYWIKKFFARRRLGDNYATMPEYQTLSERKTMVGVISIISFILMFITIPDRKSEHSTSEPREQQVSIQDLKNEHLTEQQLTTEQDELAKEEARLAEERRIAEEEKASQEAEKRRLAEEKAKREAEERRLVEEKVKREAEERKKNPYYDYRNHDRGLIGYQLYRSISKTPKIKQFLEEREDVPYKGFISEDELQNLEYRKVSFTKNTLYPDRYEMDEHGDILYNGHTSLEIPIVSKIKGELTPAWKGIFAKRLPSGEIVPVYIGYIGQGTFEEYGILFETVLSNQQYFTYIKYEGGFKKHKFDGEGNLYEIDATTLNDEFPKIKVSSGNFREGKKVGDFVEYIGDEFVYKQY